MSKEDRYALLMMEKSKTIINGHYQVALPWRPGAPYLEDNYEQAKVRLSHLKGRLLKNPMLKERYVDVVSSYISQGHAEQVSKKQAATSGWYLPHHPVQHPYKPDKVRVVSDCGAKYAGNSLNAQLLKGPDFMSSLVGSTTTDRIVGSRSVCCGQLSWLELGRSANEVSFRKICNRWRCGTNLSPCLC